MGPRDAQGGPLTSAEAAIFGADAELAGDLAQVDEVQLTVTDTGSWKAPQPAGKSRRGRGFMRALMHNVTIHPADSGTTVRLHARIT